MHTRTFAARQHLDPHDLDTRPEMSEREYTHKTKRDPELGLLKVHGMDKDLLWHVLYDDDLELMRDILLQVPRMRCTRGAHARQQL